MELHWMAALAGLVSEHEACQLDRCAACDEISLIREIARDLLDLADQSGLQQLRAQYAVHKGTTAEIRPGIWDAYTLAKDLGAANKRDQDFWEERIREQAGHAAALTVGGRKVAVRVTRTVTGASWTNDYYRRTR